MRPSKDEYFMRMAWLASTRATCLRRAVGCVLVNPRGHVLSTGYNGPPAGHPHCNERAAHSDGSFSFPHACASAFEPSGVGLDECRAVHAEQNALIQCRDAFDIETAYVTVAPCVSCLKLLLNTSCSRLVIGGWYTDAHRAVLEEWWRDPLTGAKREILELKVAQGYEIHEEKA